MILAANLKTNLTRSATSAYLESLQSFVQTHGVTQKVIVFPATSSLLPSKEQVIVGAQNAYPAKNGAFTGEIGLEQLEEFAVKTILIGHSERRHVLGETQEELVRKFNFFKEQGFEIVYCIGEPLEIREAGEDAMMQYIDAQYKGIDTTYEKLIIAYEPVWAIGTGKTPTLEDITSLHAKLKSKSKAPLLYGGSVNMKNYKDILPLPNVDGVLVGGAALNVDDFAQFTLFAQTINK
ncbi:MAG: triose-phosphate isomerase [Sulfurimonadaceae bacterium]|jgi:triosephosphate isomerase|nr:triose-phosphate isomerase [Sulfurimonadaceae bacterium]